MPQRRCSGNFTTDWPGSLVYRERARERASVKEDPEVEMNRLRSAIVVHPRIR